MAELADQLKPLDLSPTEATVLNVIEANRNATQSSIGRLLGIASANMAPLVSRLVERDLVARNPVNGRSHGLALTKKGYALTARVKLAFAKNEKSLLVKLPASQHEAFLTMLRALAPDVAD